MIEQTCKIIKIPVEEIVVWLREKTSLPSTLNEIRLEEKMLILSFIENDGLIKDNTNEQTKKVVSKKRASRKRNRMKTRGWQAIARITNSKGQQCTIYKPFVDALDKPNLTNEEQKLIVEQILKSNKNKPSEESIKYYLENTLEYLKQRSV